MKVCTYLQHILSINLEELPSLPPFNPNQSLSNDEIIEILLYGTPKSCQKEMSRQEFDPMSTTVQELVNFMERIEEAEGFDTNDAEQPSVKPRAVSGQKGKPLQKNLHAPWTG